MLRLRAGACGVLRGWCMEVLPYSGYGRRDWAVWLNCSGYVQGWLFVQWKTTTPLASEGYRRSPLGIWFRFCPTLWCPDWSYGEATTMFRVCPLAGPADGT